jgi:hypothetical protein
VVVVSDSVPPPLTVHVTPSLFVSFVTVAVRVSVSVPSTVVADAVTATVFGAELPPQPEMLKAATIVIANRPIAALILRPERTNILRNTDASQIV